MNDRLSKTQLRVDCQNTLLWLQSVLQERIAPGVLLDWDAPSLRWRLRIAGQLGQIWIGDPTTQQVDPVGDSPCVEWKSNDDGWNFEASDPLLAPGLGAPPKAWLMREQDGWWLRYDVIRLMFHMLSRSEEVGHPYPDLHLRFPATASNAAKKGYLHRPVVDEWMQLIRRLAKSAWPSVDLMSLRFKMHTSHDIDFPSRYALCSFGSYARSVGIDVLRHGRIVDAVRSPWWRMRGATDLHPNDPANTFDWIMDLSEQHELRSAFYFICGRTAPRFDGGYEIKQPAIAALLRKIHNRGHEIGLHPSYGAYRDNEQLSMEAKQLRSVCASLGINQSTWGGRMHFLRWSHPETLHLLVRAGLNYDATMTYADRAGFRCGTCFDYAAFDPLAREVLPLRIRPLIAMECSVMDPSYMGLGTGAEAYEEFVRLKNACRAVGGTFSLLWHNTELYTPALKDLYCSILNA